MERLDIIWNAFRSWLEQLIPHAWLDYLLQLVSNPPREFLSIAILIPVALVLISRRVLPILATILLAGLAWLTLYDTTLFTAIGSQALFVAGLIVAGVGLRSKRRERALSAEIATLRADVTQLQAAEARRFISGLKSRKPDAQALKDDKTSDQAQ